MALNACQAPVILTFQEGTAGEAIHLQGHHIIALHKVFRNVEFGRHIRIFAIAHTLSVHPQVEAMPYPIETHKDVVSSQFISCYVEFLAISADRILHIVVVGEPAWTVGHNAVCRLVERKRISHITIKRFVPSLTVFHSPHLPA